jgi:hypothetical protein
MSATDGEEPWGEVRFDFGSRLPAKAQERFLHNVLAAMVVSEQTTDVGQQRSFKPPRCRDHPIVVLPHVGSFDSKGSTCEREDY